MNCFYHKEIEAITSCQGCGRALCSRCVNAFTKNYCLDCTRDIRKEKKDKAVNELIISVIVFVVAYLYSGNESILHPYRFLYGILAMILYFGWVTTKQITRNVSISASPLGWLIYVTLRMFLAGMIGVFVFPYRLFSIIGTVRAYKNIQKNYREE